MANQGNAPPPDAMPHGLDGFDFITQSTVGESDIGVTGTQRLQVRHLTPVYTLGPIMQEPTPAVAPMWGVHVEEAFNSAENTTNTSSVDAIQPPTDPASWQRRLRQDWDHHQEALRTSLNSIQDGFLEPASQSLLATTTWLVNRVPDLGLDIDPQDPSTAEAVFTARLGVWKALNYAWLALCSKQLELMRSQPQARGAIMCRATISHMGNELVRLCDILQKDGLVDYEYGIWEEEIMEELILCLDQYDYILAPLQT
ncbi:hypothetical protein EDB81DRAFT_751758 [Dactylonectria macrodidyma]|uniref:Uncharacterized protein n=1 Tax=Dactylonectria macrodidyma TaxID=307937 RepID=A0A9P9FW36_9HYPO|nr:hypothetical protein EDB81DRAFT_751758 [Dactylonectria macrodidyma]